MEGYCKYCGHAVEDVSVDGIGRMITNHKNLYSWEDARVGAEELVPGLGTVKVLHNSYLTVDEGDIKIVWETPFGLVAVTGYYSSYGGTRWNDSFSVAEKKTKEVVYFE